MINRYVPDGKGYRRISVEEQAEPVNIPPVQAKQDAQPVFQPLRPQTPPVAPTAPIAPVAPAPAVAPSGGNQALRAKIGGDLVLLLLLALVLVDGDELDLTITLALILILGL